MCIVKRIYISLNKSSYQKLVKSVNVNMELFEMQLRKEHNVDHDSEVSIGQFPPAQITEKLP